MRKTATQATRRERVDAEDRAERGRHALAPVPAQPRRRAVAQHRRDPRDQRRDLTERQERQGREQALGRSSRPTMTPVRLPRTRPTLVAPGFPDPEWAMSMPRARAMSVAGEMVPTR